MAEEMYGSQAAGSSRIGTIIISVAVFIVLLAAGIYVYKEYYGKRTIQGFIINRDITVNDSLEYEDRTIDAKSWEWDFGNGFTSLKRSGKYKFKAPGVYDVKLEVDHELSNVFRVNVRDTVAAADTSIIIDGPARGIVGEEIRFSARGNGNRWEWRFGESGAVDMVGPEAFYKYSAPGIYAIKLSNLVNATPATLKIRILPELADTTTLVKIDPEVEAVKAAKQRVYEIRSKLQSLANGNDFNSLYYDVLQNYLCNDENALVVINGNKKTDFYKYCTHLQFEKGVVIDELVVQESPNGCATSLTIKEHFKVD